MSTYKTTSSTASSVINSAITRGSSDRWKLSY